MMEIGYTHSVSISDLSPHFALMGFLYLRSMHGYDLHKQLEANLREVWRISQSQAYAILKRLEREGWVRAEHQPQEKRPERSCFSLTPDGRARFEAWLYGPTPSSARALRVELLTRLFFAASTQAGLAPRLLHEQAVYSRAGLEALRRRLDNIPPDQLYNRLSLELRIRQLITLLDWMETCELTPSS